MKKKQTFNHKISGIIPKTSFASKETPDYTHRKKNITIFPEGKTEEDGLHKFVKN